MVKLEIEYILIIAIILFGIYLLIGRCSCNDGFSIGGTDWTSIGSPSVLEQNYDEYDFDIFARPRKLVDCSPLSYEDLINLTEEEKASASYTFRCNKDIKKEYRNDRTYIRTRDAGGGIEAISQQCVLFGWSPTHRSYYRTDCANPNSHSPPRRDRRIIDPSIQADYVLFPTNDQLKFEMTFTNENTDYENKVNSEGNIDVPRYYPLEEREKLYKEPKFTRRGERHALPAWVKHSSKYVGPMIYIVANEMTGGEAIKIDMRSALFTVRELKESIARRRFEIVEGAVCVGCDRGDFDEDIDRMDLIFNGKKLEDDQTLKYYGIESIDKKERDSITIIARRPPEDDLFHRLDAMVKERIIEPEESEKLKRLYKEINDKRRDLIALSKGFEEDEAFARQIKRKLLTDEEPDGGGAAAGGGAVEGGDEDAVLALGERMGDTA